MTQLHNEFAPMSDPCVTRLLHVWRGAVMCDMIHSYMRHDSLICDMTLLIENSKSHSTRCSSQIMYTRICVCIYIHVSVHMYICWCSYTFICHTLSHPLNICHINIYTYVYVYMLMSNTYWWFLVQVCQKRPIYIKVQICQKRPIYTYMLMPNTYCHTHSICVHRASDP